MNERDALPPDPLTNIDAEAALLGSMLMDNGVILAWSDRLKVDDFAEPVHQRIFTALLRFSAKGVTASAVSLRPVFALDEDADRGDYLARLVDTPAALVGANEFAAQVIDLSDRRVARAALDIANDELARDFDTSVLEITGRVEAAGWAASARAAAKPVRTLADMIGMAEQRVDRIQDDGQAPGLQNLLVPDLDKILGPLETGYHILAGRPGMGKTTLAVSAALGYSALGHPGLYCSGEMTEEQLGMRVTTDLAFALGYKIKHDAMRRGALSPQERAMLRGTAERAAALPLDFVDLRGANIRRVWSEVARRKAMWAARGRRLGFCVVDSIGLFDADIDGRLIDDDRKRVNEISKTLNQMAHALDVAVIALNQLSRGVEGRTSKRPVLSDLKESGNLEQDADSVTFIYREEYYLEQTEPKRGQMERNVDLHEEWEVAMNIARGKADLIGAKNRHGRNMTRTVNFFGDYYSVREASVSDVGFDDPLLL